MGELRRAGADSQRAAAGDVAVAQPVSRDGVSLPAGHLPPGHVPLPVHDMSVDSLYNVSFHF